MIDDGGWMVMHHKWLNSAYDPDHYVHISDEEPAIAHRLIAERIMFYKGCVDHLGMQHTYNWQVT